MACARKTGKLRLEHRPLLKCWARCSERKAELWLGAFASFPFLGSRFTGMLLFKETLLNYFLLIVTFLALPAELLTER